MVIFYLTYFSFWFNIKYIRNLNEYFHMSKKIYIYDLETLKNVFTATFISKDSDETKQFVIWKDRNEIKELVSFVNSLDGMVGFNNIGFDYPVIHYILSNKNKLYSYTGDKIAKLIYKEAQRLIKLEWSQIRNPWIPQLDLFKIHHFDNKAKMTNLKKLEIALGFENVQDMPIKHDQEVTSDSQILEILDYNLNDVKATKLFYEKTADKIKLRRELQARYELPCLNYSDSKIGEELVLKLYCKATEQNPSVIKKRRTYRKAFRFRECIPDYVSFSTNEFKSLLEYLKQIEVNELKQSFEYEFVYRDIPFHLGTGGLHGCCKEGIYESNEEEMIVDCDVAGMYPSIAMVNKYYPQHLGEQFCDVYEKDIILPRLEAKKRGDKVLADGFKLSGNSIYGKSNSEYSFCYDPLYTLKTTLTGQLSLCMLCEMLFTGIPELKMLQANTDGITVIIPRKDKRLYWEICKEWETITKLTLEYVAYEKMIIRDVNNYTSISEDGKVKYKGVFKLHSKMIEDGEWHKAFNQGIVPIALSEYFLNNKPVEDVIKNHKEIFDFCKTFNATHGWRCETVNIDELGNEYDLVNEQKTNRYYVSNKGKIFRKIKEALAPKYNKTFFYNNEHEESVITNLIPIIQEELEKAISLGVIETSQKAELKIYTTQDILKVLNKYDKHLNYIFNVSTVILNQADEEKIDISKDFRVIEIESDNLVTIFNKYVEKDIEEYDINYEYYINECNKIIDTITGEKERRERELKEKRLREKMDREESNYIKFCVQKIPTTRQFQEYSREWLIEKYGHPSEIKESKLKASTEGVS